MFAIRRVWAGAAILALLMVFPNRAWSTANQQDPNAGDFDPNGGGGGNQSGGGSNDLSSGQIFGSAAYLSLEDTALQLRLLSRRTEQASTDEGGLLVFAAPAGSNDLVGTIAAYQPFADGRLTVRGQSCDCFDRAGWAIGAGLGGTVESNGQAPQVRYTLGGIQLGAGMTLDCGSMAGVFGSYANSDVRQSIGPASVDIDHSLIGSFLRRESDTGYYLLAGCYSYDDYSSSRTALAAIATAKYHGDQAAVYLERGFDFWWNCVRLQPLGALQYIHVQQSDFAEQGAGAANLFVNGTETDSLRSILGTRISIERCTQCWGLWVPELHTSWIHEFLDTGSSVLVGAAPAVSVAGLNVGRDFALAGIGGSLHVTDQLHLYANYDLQLNDRETFHIGSGGAQYLW